MKIVVSIIIASSLVIFALVSTRDDSAKEDTEFVSQNNVSVVDGEQIIEIKAKGGYEPRVSVAKSGLPTVIRFNTYGTLDCSLSVRIPSMKISQFLAQSGSTDIDIGVSKEGVLQGSCGMGMYPFKIEFKS
jgi:plastocyanin domain-containing protein